MKATLIGRVNQKTNTGLQHLWNLDPPLNERGKQIDHVVTSVIDSSFGCECLIFESDSNGVIQDWGDLGGGEELCADEALKTIGYSAHVKMKTERNRFIRWQMKRWGRQGRPRGYSDALYIWITYQWLGRHY